MDDLMSMLDAAPEGAGIDGAASDDDDVPDPEPADDRPKAKSGFSMLRGLK